MARPRKALSDDFPDELSSVASNMNLLIGSERGRAERYRNTLDNLAHSLKTPLAAIRAVLSEQQQSTILVTNRVEEQIERMNDIVRYQLAKPATIHGGELRHHRAAGTLPEIDKLVAGLRKVHRDKNPQIDVDVDKTAMFRGDTGDLLELAGNLLDNACKWCESRVAVSVQALDGVTADTGNLLLAVEDDGPGIPQDARDALLQRGMRLDENAPGHGIGLAVVKELAASYDGEVTIGDSALGGAKISVTIRPGTPGN